MMNSLRGIVAALTLVLVLNVAARAAAAGEQDRQPASSEGSSMWCFIGTTASEPPHQSHGIYVSRFNAETGKLTKPELAAETAAPSFLALAPGGKFLYATREAASGGAAAFAIDRASGKLSPLNAQPTGGAGPCFVGLDGSGKELLVANYGSGSIAALPVAEDGSLKPPAAVVQDHGSGPVAKRQDGPHAHSFNADPSHRFALACDLGTDQVLVFKLDSARATLTPNDPPYAKVPPGSGPRHLAFHPGGRFAYVINELGNTITAFSWDGERGTLGEVQTISTLPAGYSKETYAAEVRVHPGGQFLYGSNRGHDSIAVFAIDQGTGKLSPRGHVSTGGKWPRNFQIDPTGRWLVAANEHSHDLVVFKIDPQTGQLERAGERVEVPSPSCVRFLP